MTTPDDLTSTDIYPDKESYSSAPIVTIIGPIEYWWDTDEEPDRFNSEAAVEYRAFREVLSDALSDAGFLVYRPHKAFKGNWNEKAQVVNDAGIHIADLVINISPKGVPGLGTAHEERLALSEGKDVYHLYPDNLKGYLYREDMVIFAKGFLTGIVGKYL